MGKFESVDDIHDVLMDRTIVQIKTMKKISKIFEYFKSLYSQEEISQIYNQNLNHFKDQLSQLGLSSSKTLQQTLKKIKNKNFSLYKSLDKTENDLLEFYNEEPSGGQELSEEQIGGVSPKTKKVKKSKKIKQKKMALRSEDIE